MTDQVPLPALSQLCNSVHASPEYADCGEGQSGYEAFEFEGVAKLCVEGILVEGLFTHGFVTLAGAEGEVGAEDYEDEEGRDLEGETGYHDVVAWYDGLV